MNIQYAEVLNPANHDLRLTISDPLALAEQNTHTHLQRLKKIRQVLRFALAF